MLDNYWAHTREKRRAEQEHLHFNKLKLIVKKLLAKEELTEEDKIFLKELGL